MRNDTTEALCRLVTMFVTAIEHEGATIPEQLVGQIATDPLKACEELNELALSCGAIDDELDDALAAVYESMDAADARSAVDEQARERVLRAYDEAHHEPEPEPEPEPEVVNEQPAGEGEAEQEGNQEAEPARKTRGRRHRQRAEAAHDKGEEPFEGAQPEAEPVAEQVAQDVASAPEAQAAPKSEATSELEPQTEPAPQPKTEPEAKTVPEPSHETEAAPAPEPAAAEPKTKAAKPASPKPAPAAAGDVLTVDQAIAILGVSRPTVYKLIESGQLPAYKKGRSWQISAEAVAARAAK